jgi:hypothetical protein
LKKKQFWKCDKGTQENCHQTIFKMRNACKKIFLLNMFEVPQWRRRSEKVQTFFTGKVSPISPATGTTVAPRNVFGSTQAFLQSQNKFFLKKPFFISPSGQTL